MSRAKNIILVPLLIPLIVVLIGILPEKWTWDSVATWEQISNIVLSWPFLVIVFLSTFVWLFHEQIGVFLSEIREFETPAGRLSRQSQQVKAVDSMPVELVKFIIERDSDWQQLVDSQNQVIMNASEERETLIKHIKYLIKDNLTWVFLFADAYLVPNTKRTLLWLHGAGEQTRGEINDYQKEFCPEQGERDAIIQALRFVKFILEPKPDVISISRLGSHYVEYLMIKAKQGPTN